MIKLDTPWWARLQNFVFLPGKTHPEWTTASETPLDKLIRLVAGKPKMARTRTSGKISGHGQLVQLRDGKLVNDDEGLMSWGESYSLQGVPGRGTIQQGLDQDDKFIYTAFGNAGKGSINIFKHTFDKKIAGHGALHFRLFDKWYHRKWEPEGLRVHPVTGEVWIGINVPTIFGTHQNFIYKIKTL